MDVQTIAMDPAEAREKLKEFRTGLHRKADTEWQAAALGYEALSKGTPLINLPSVLVAAPHDEKGRPMLAVGRADVSQIVFEFQSGINRETWCTMNDARNGWRPQRGKAATTPKRLDFDLERKLPAGLRTWEARGYALVPMVPPSAGHHDRAKHYVLWEVPSWSDKPIGAVAPIDPYLLRHLGGDLYAIIAEWDLTDLERAVMGRRASA